MSFHDEVVEAFAEWFDANDWMHLEQDGWEISRVGFSEETFSFSLKCTKGHGKMLVIPQFVVSSRPHTSEAVFSLYESIESSSVQEMVKHWEDFVEDLEKMLDVWFK